MQLNELLQDYGVLTPSQNRLIQGITIDSRQVKPGDVFFAVPGHQADGRNYIEQALHHGAMAIITQAADQRFSSSVITNTRGEVIPIAAIPELPQQLGLLAARFYGEPAKKLKIIGVTGTSGKTSCVQLAAHALEQLGIRAGTIGTLGYGLCGTDLQPTHHATPGALELQRILAQLHSQGAQAVAMEVSSHGLMQHRVQGVQFDVGVFTNLSHEHLDYHGDMAHYAAAKRRLFNSPGLAAAVINADDAYGRQWLNELKASLPVYGYGLEDSQRVDLPCLLTASEIKLTLTGIQAKISSPWGESALQSRLLGRFNLSNLLAVLAALKALGVDWQQAVHCIDSLPMVPGRMDCFGGHNQPLVVVDYAHKPDALAQVLQVLRTHCPGKLWCVFGCGGDRDRLKRPLMGQIAERYADDIMLTNDNPRFEDAEAIITEIQQGFSSTAAARVEHDRAAAIAYAIEQAQPGDIVLVAGKGHEDYQIVGDQYLPFSDIECVKSCLAAS